MNKIIELILEDATLLHPNQYHVELDLTNDDIKYLKYLKSIKIEYDDIIKNKDELINQLESLKEEAIYMLRNPFHDEVFQKDLHALKIVLHMLEGVR